MKRIIAAAFIIIFSFTGCTVKYYTPKLPEAFTETARVTWGDFSYKCEICKNLQSVKVTVLDTTAKGLVMSYDGERLTFAYNDLVNFVSESKSVSVNTAVILFEAFDYLSATDTAEIKKTDTGYSYFGKISCGDFLMLQNDDDSIKSLTVKGENYKIEFSDR